MSQVWKKCCFEYIEYSEEIIIHFISLQLLLRHNSFLQISILLRTFHTFENTIKSILVIKKPLRNLRKC